MVPHWIPLESYLTKDCVAKQHSLLLSRALYYKAISSSLPHLDSQAYTHTHIHTPPSATQAPLVSWGCLGSYFVILLGVGYGWCHPFRPDHGHHSTPEETCRTRRPLPVSGAESNWPCVHSRALRKRCMCALRGVHKCVCVVQYTLPHPRMLLHCSHGPQRARKPFPASPPQAGIQCCDGCQGAGEPVTVMLRFRGKMVLGIFRPTQMLYLRLGLPPSAQG